MLNVFFHDSNMATVFYGNIFFLIILAVKLRERAVSMINRKQGLP